MAKFVGTVKAIITRLVFASHGFIAIWQVTTFKKNPYYWYLSTPIILLLFEGIFTVTIKVNQEWKWFCPSVFLYLGSVVPAIWLLELDKLERRMRSREANFNISETFDLTNLAADDLKHLEKAFGVNLRLPEIQISTETWVTLIEQFLMLILIIGRWMLPKGDLTRDQLSQLLLVYIGTAADIIEFFDSFKEDKIGRELLLVYLTLGIWSWSLMQFTVVLTATKSRKSRLSSGTTIKKKMPTETSCCTIDVWAIAINMVLQDAPFLAFRLLIIIHYQIVSYMNIFFTCKNTLVILLQLYRLYVVQSENSMKKRKKQRYHRHEMPTISIVSRSDMYKYENTRTKKRKRDVEVDCSSESHEHSEEQDIYQLSPKKLQIQKKGIRKQDTGYSTCSSRNSSKHDKSYKKEENKHHALSSRNRSHGEDSCNEDEKKKSRKKMEKSWKIRKSELKKSQSHRRRNKVEDDDDDSEESEETSPIESEYETTEEQRYTKRKRRNRD